MRATTPGVLLVLSACGGAGSIDLPRPATFASADPALAVAWADSTIPQEARDVRFRWSIRDDRGAAGGRGRVRFARPDSARLDARGPLGSGQAAAFVSGDSALWAEPEEDVRRLVPNYPIFWAMMGIARAPEPRDLVRRYVGPSYVAWQYVRGVDTVDYVHETNPKHRLIVEVREGREKVGVVETLFGADGLPASSRLIVPSVPARLDLTFYSNVKADRFAPDTWTPPER